MWYTKGVVSHARRIKDLVAWVDQLETQNRSRDLEFPALRSRFLDWNDVCRASMALDLEGPIADTALTWEGKLTTPLSYPKAHWGGYVYLATLTAWIQNGMKAPYCLLKIGHTTNPSNREAQLRQASPFDVVIVHAVQRQDYLRHERQLHKQFGHARTHGEWFLLSQAELRQLMRSMGS